MNINDDVFNKVEKKTNIKKEDIISIASNLNEGNMKDPATLKDVIHKLSKLAGKDVSEKTENKIIDLILEDKVPKNIDKFF